MPFAYAFSKSATAMRPSPIRELFKLIQRPGMISFAGGLPDPAIFPVEEFAHCAEALSEHGHVALQYGATEGYRPLVDELARRMEKPLGRVPSPEELLIASGSQQIMDMISRVLIDPGDVIVVEAPTYPGALHTFRNAGARFALVPCDSQGMQVETLEEVIATCRRATGKAPKLIYTIINFSNPSGACLATDRRRRLAEIAGQHAIPVLEDDPYGALRYRGEALPTLFSMADGGVLFASSFSKILAPGTRVAWAVGDAELIRKMVVAKQGMDLCTSMVAQVLIAEYCRRGYLEDHLPRICAHYAAKARAMSAALREELDAGAARWSDPEGGFFFWLELPGRDTREVFRRAVDEGVAFLPGPAFYPEPDETVGATVDGSSMARLCFTFAGGEEIAEGSRRLARALA
ncbi:MAG: PLP-dependent aminotransferase family protein [Thermoanaerobaculaceae bacterium]|nr:PLP-dependent aminotransferase family protein [Thermoanaerobaculaceae bacterium]MDI9622017.1 PLP-dependent aminotransferase family protein [Acidobacteriota bacterium]NLH10499.1 PLP-dependent aminotransferase family protein [Holophagae bacterium]HPW54807.1 PLP-dependent aminotransferase family protein [Thermoanaerobaculaceae bacterium]